MEDTWEEITRKNIMEYISKIDFKNPDLNIKVIKEELSNIIGFEPAIKINWKEIVKENQLLKESGADNYIEKEDKAVSIDIGIINDNKPKMFKFII